LPMVVSTASTINRRTELKLGYQYSMKVKSPSSASRRRATSSTKRRVKSSKQTDKRQLAFDLLAEGLRDRDCTRCRLSDMGCKTVCMPGVGPLDADVMVIADAPSMTDDGAGEPFVGRGGTLIRQSLKEAGIDPSTVYMTYATNCANPDGKAPSSAQLRECRHWVQARIKQVKPKYVLLMGNISLESLLFLRASKRHEVFRSS